MILMVFIDGLGIGEDNPEINPLARDPELWPAGERLPSYPGLHCQSLDANLGIEGLPQSATGQTALLTGVNASARIGKHQQGFPSRQLIEILETQSIFVRLKACGLRGTFANAYRHPEDIHPASRLSVTSHALKASGQPFRSLDQLRQREALYHDFSNQHLREKGYDAPLFSAKQAARILISIARQNDFTLYEHFLTDILAHRAEEQVICHHLVELGRFVRALLRGIAGQPLTLIITSDHGNIEDSRSRTHTRNPVPLLWSGMDSRETDPRPADIAGVTPWVLRVLGSSQKTDTPKAFQA
jgi:2,3-bisphosphoglycerate-independent phosphoglycerate mutase